MKTFVVGLLRGVSMAYLLYSARRDRASSPRRKDCNRVDNVVFSLSNLLSAEVHQHHARPTAAPCFDKQ